MIAAVTPSISRMPGPPLGPSWRITTTSPALMAPACTAAKAASSPSNTRAGPWCPASDEPATFTTQPSRRDVAVQHEQPAGRLERRVERAHDVLSGRLAHCRGLFADASGR